MDQLGNAQKQEIDRWNNNRTRTRTCRFDEDNAPMRRFRQMKTLQKFSSVHAQVHSHFTQDRNLVDSQI